MKGLAASIAVAILVAGLLWLVYASYQRDIHRASERISTGSQVINTRCGPIEYATAGQGPAVLLVHGAGGGFDQTLGIANELARQGFHAITMSRFGYLRTPLPADASPAAQADAHACLLDALGIERAAMVGVSAGAPSSMQFALRHPKRITALVLLVPLAYAPRDSKQPSPVAQFMLERATQSDLLYWAALKSAPSLIVKTILATPPGVRRLTHIKECVPACGNLAVMDEFDGSLNAQHVQIDRQLDAVVAAGRAGRWPEYRQHLGALREGLAQHMAFEEEALFPALEQGAAAAVRELREQHARLRRHLEVLGAAAPEQDPEGCLAELAELAALLSSHHAAEMALDPQYAIRRMPQLALSDPAPMDLRGLQPPEPLVRIFQALERGPGAPLRVILPHEPVPLYGLLRERGYSYAGSPRSDGGFEVLIERE